MVRDIIIQQLVIAVDKIIPMAMQIQHHGCYGLHSMYSSVSHE